MTHTHLGTLEDQGNKSVARDFYGRIVGSDNLLSGLIAQAAVKNGYSIDGRTHVLYVRPVFLARVKVRFVVFEAFSSKSQGYGKSSMKPGIWILGSFLFSSKRAAKNFFSMK